MATPDIDTLIAQLNEGPLEDSLFADVVARVAEGFPNVAEVALDGGSASDAALHLVDLSCPGWTIQLHGKALEPDGHWRCTLRETSSRDNDAFIGVGTGPTVGHAVLIALLRLVKSGAQA